VWRVHLSMFVKMNSSSHFLLFFCSSFISNIHLYSLEGCSLNYRSINIIITQFGPNDNMNNSWLVQLLHFKCVKVYITVSFTCKMHSFSAWFVHVNWLINAKCKYFVTRSLFLSNHIECNGKFILPKYICSYLTLT